MGLAQVAHYRVLRKLGEGGMGQVYLGQDLKLNRYVAIKFLPRECFGDQERLQRFHREAKIASSVNHPNVLTIHSIEEDEGELFIITEFVDGQTLRQKIDEGPLSPLEAVSIARHIAEALAAAHDFWIVHRDIKPSNVMIREDGVVKVLDFGIAKLRDPAMLGLGDDTSITMPGCVPGSLRYVAPERLRGEAADPRSDIYSLGAVCYEMLAGIPPFAGRTLATTIDLIVNHEPIPLRARRGDVPEHLIAIIEKSLQKDPENRYQSTSELIEDLRSLEDRLRYEALMSPARGVSGF